MLACTKRGVSSGHVTDYSGFIFEYDSEACVTVRSISIVFTLRHNNRMTNRSLICFIAFCDVFLVNINVSIEYYFRVTGYLTKMDTSISKIK